MDIIIWCYRRLHEFRNDRRHRCVSQHPDPHGGNFYILRQPPQGLRRLKMVFLLDIPLPDMTLLQNYYVTDSNGTEGAEKLFREISRVMEETRDRLESTQTAQRYRQ